MTSLKTIVVVSVILVLFLAGWYLYYTAYARGGKTIIETEFKGYNKIDKLFTGFAYIPLTKYKTGNLKREYPMALFKEGESIKGYCFRQYEVGIGYDKVTDLFLRYQEAACAGKTQDLAEPRILSTNPVCSEATGTYTRTECDSWDIGSLDQRDSQQLIVDELQNQNWQHVVENSRKMLMSFMRVYCP